MLNVTLPHGGGAYHEEQHKANGYDEASMESAWFSAFIKHTNQKVVTAKKMGALLNNFAAQQQSLGDIKLLDIGCGEGEMLQNITILFQAAPIGLLSAIDKDVLFLQQAADKFRGSSFPVKMIQADCFNMNYGLLGLFNVILASNILYYCKNISQFVSTTLKALDEYGVMILVHEDSTSSPRVMRKKYKAKISDDIPKSVKAAAFSCGAHVIEYSLDSHIQFNKDLAMLLKGVKTYAHVAAKLEREDILLLEFIAQTSLRTMETKGNLESYLIDIQDICATNKGKVPIVSRIQVVSKRELRGMDR